MLSALYKPPQLRPHLSGWRRRFVVGGRWSVKPISSQHRNLFTNACHQAFRDDTDAAYDQRWLLPSRRPSLAATRLMDTFAVGPKSALAEPIFAGRHVCIVAAHPDDEVIGFGGQMPTVARLTLIHLTEGATTTAAWHHGFATAASYARARRQELEAAYRLAGVPVVPIQFGLRDQAVSFALRSAIPRLAVALAATAPDIVITHPYEGGHPDHDSAAFITAAALRHVPAPPPHWEMTSYHAGSDGAVTGVFLPNGPAICAKLPPVARDTKAAMLACFTSQRATLAPFGADEEWFRPAPSYDFTQAPHPGRLHYESRRRALHGQAWRQLVADAMSPPSWSQRVRHGALRLWIAG